MRRRTLNALIGILSIATLNGTSVAADGYPEHPITMIVPWGAGGGTDTLARSFAVHLEKELGQPVNVVNRTGGSGVVGHAAIATAQPDGYTIGLGTIEIATFKSLGLADLTPRDITPIAHLAVAPAGLTVAADRFADAATALEEIKSSKPGTFTASGTGQGGSWHFAIAGLLSDMGLAPDHVRWVPSQGGAPALQDLMAQGVDFFTGSPVEAKSLLDSGRVETMFIMHSEIVPAFPDIPTLESVADSTWTMGSPYMLIGPAELPEELQAKLETAAQAAFQNTEFQDYLATRGFAPQWMNSADLEAFLAERAETLGAISEQLGLGG